MVKNNKKYIITKIENCDKLIEGTYEAGNCVNVLLKEVYEGYKGFWTKKLNKRDQPDEVAKREAAKQAKIEVVRIAKEEKDAIIFAEAETARVEALRAEAKLKKKSELEKQLADLKAADAILRVEEEEAEPEV